jgi:ornithine cyclodeaminase/alanine dehydrogenase-like protein (mu-crystallin family)
VIILTNEEIEPLLNMPDCLAAIEQAFRDFGNGHAVDIPRQDAIVPNPRPGAIHDLKTMSGSWPAAGIAALRLNSDIVHWPTINDSRRRVKLAISQPGGRYNGAVLLFSTKTGQLLCMLNDGIMQKSRVGASSGVAAKYLAPESPRTLGLLGTGLQAGGQLEAMCLVRRFEEVKVYSPTAANRATFADHFRRRLQINITPVASAEEAASGADVLVTATNSLRPTIRPEWVKPGMHISSIRRSELPVEVFGKVDRLVVNARVGGETYLADGCPDVPEDNSSGVPHIADVPELKDLVAGRTPGRRSRDEITCFHNYQGLGLQFAAVGSIVYREAVKRKVGLVLDDRYFTQSVHP